MRQLLLPALLVLLPLGAAHAQGKMKLTGTVIDKQTSEAVAGATVRLLSLPDSVQMAGVTTNADGVFSMKDVGKGRALLKITFVGYADKLMPVDLTARKGRAADLGYITMSEDETVLRDVEVVGTQAKVQVSGDSLVFNASAYPVPEGSTLEALLKLLPGAKVDEEGNITINGKTVNKILVDGKEFFLNDKEVALKNIPTDIIDKVKSYERKSDMARVTGIDDGDDETVLDLTVKKGMNNGWFGNINAGAGTAQRYNGRAMVNRFNDDMQMSVLANARNTPNRWWRQPGLTSRKDVGVNFASTSPTIEMGGSIRYRYNGTDQAAETSSENFAAQRGAFSQSRSQSYSSNANVQANFRMEWKPDTLTNIILRPNLSFARNRSRGSSRSGSFDTDPNRLTENVLDYNDQIAQLSADTTATTTDELLGRLMDIVVNTNTSRNVSFSRSVTAGGELQLNRKLSAKGRNLTLRLTGSYNDGESKQLSAARITYNTLGTTQQNNRYYLTPSLSYNMAAQLSYSEPIADRTYLQLSYQYQYAYSRNDRQASVYDSQAYRDLTTALEQNRYDVDAVLRFMQEAGQHMRDTVELSQFSEYRNYNQTATLQLRRVRDSYNASIGLDALPQRTTLNYRYMGREYPQVTRTVFNIAPRAELQVKFDQHTNMRFRYNGRTQQPSMTNLLDITDDSNPLHITKGNPGLKPAFIHNFNGNFNGYNPERQRSLWAWVGGNIIRNSISNKTTYDKQTGVETTMPMNINGNWNIGGGTGMNTALGEKKLFNLGGNLGGGYQHSVGFYNNVSRTDADDTDIKSVTKNLSLDGGLSTSYRTGKLSIELRGNVRWARLRNNVNPDNNQQTWNYTYGTNAQWTMPWGTQIATDINMNSRRGYAQSSMNTDELLWNASLSHSFFKGNALTVKAEVFDLLGQQTNISRSVTAFMRSDSMNNAIYQYGLLSLIYRFSVFAGKNTMGTDQERREDWRRRW
ncbi:MAG: outer membrane beta-barrel protein [Prevotella sp.]|nr:outer membrane beta-barrel protein [Prevotella sp.]